MSPARFRRTAAALACAWAAAAPALEVRVDPAGGAPRLTVDGRPVRARMFWGAPGAAPLRATTNGTTIAFEFTATGAATNGTIHFRFGAQAGDVFLDDIEILDLDAGRPLLTRCDFEAEQGSFGRDWTFWPPDATGTVAAIAVEPGVGSGGSAGLRVTLKERPGGGPGPDFHLYSHPRMAVTEGHRCRVSFHARATPARNLTVAVYRPGSSYVRLGGPSGIFEQQIRLAAQAGVDFVSFPIPTPWPEPGGAEDWASVDAACENVLRHNPRALLLPRIGMDPPEAWRKAHPDDVMQWDDGRRGKAVVSSPAYRRDAADRLAALIAHLEAKFGPHMAGYHPVGQNTGEWFYEDTWGRALNGYAPADRAGWQAWLRRRYGSDGALRQAWNDPAAALDTAAVPPPAARRAAPAGTFHDPAAGRAPVDWAEYQQESMAECVCDLARAARKASGGRKLVLFFYGYVFEFGPVANGPATSGHYALRRVLGSPDIDVLCSPISYFDRGPGGGAPSMTAAESVALAGKLWLNEDDTHTYLATGSPPGAADHVDTAEATVAELTRNVAQESVRNFGTWWMDLGASGWFADPELWAAMTRLRAMDETMLTRPAPFRPEVAAVVDERVMARVSAAGARVTRPGLYEVRAALGRMGAPYGQYLLDDVLAGRVRARLFVFLNAWALTADQRAQLRRATRGAGCVWCYAPGWFDGDRTSAEAMREATGFDLRPVTPPSARAVPTERGRAAGLAEAFGPASPVKPLFAAADAQPGEALATYADGSTAIALRRGPEGISMFVGPPGLTSTVLRAAAREAGVHLFANVDCHVYANGGFVAVHGAQDGPVELDLGGSGPVRDALTGREIDAGSRLTLPLRRGETRVLMR